MDVSWPTSATYACCCEKMILVMHCLVNHVQVQQFAILNCEGNCLWVALAALAFLLQSISMQVSGIDYGPYGTSSAHCCGSAQHLFSWLSVGILAVQVPSQITISKKRAPCTWSFACVAVCKSLYLCRGQAYFLFELCGCFGFLRRLLFEDRFQNGADAWGFVLIEYESFARHLDQFDSNIHDVSQH